jgi:hypothetical protein
VGGGLCIELLNLPPMGEGGGGGGDLLLRRSPPPAEVILGCPSFFLSLPGLPWRISPEPAVKSSVNCRLKEG